MVRALRVSGNADDQADYDSCESDPSRRVTRVRFTELDVSPSTCFRIHQGSRPWLPSLGPPRLESRVTLKVEADASISTRPSSSKEDEGDDEKDIERERYVRFDTASSRERTSMDSYDLARESRCTTIAHFEPQSTLFDDGLVVKVDGIPLLSLSFDFYSSFRYREFFPMYTLVR